MSYLIEFIVTDVNMGIYHHLSLSPDKADLVGFDCLDDDWRNRIAIGDKVDDVYISRSSHHILYAV